MSPSKYPNCPMCGSGPLPSASETHVYCSSPMCALNDNPIPVKIWHFFSTMRKQTKQLLKWHLIEDGIKEGSYAGEIIASSAGEERLVFYKTMGLTENNQWTDQAYKIAKVERT